MSGPGDTDPEGGQPGGEASGAPAENFNEQELELGEEEASLPWLEGDEDDEDDFGGRNAGQLIGLVLMGLLALAVLVGGIWWATRDGGDEEVVADGGVIKAPAQPYKEAPKDPGGQTFEGTGDASFVVSEGQTRPARLGETAPDTPAASPPAVEAASKSPQPDKRIAVAVATGKPEAAAPAVVGVQVGAFSTQASAEAGWGKLSQQYEALSGLNHRIVEGQADIGKVYRLQALAGDAAGATALCRKLKAAGLNCQVKN